MDFSSKQHHIHRSCQRIKLKFLKFLSDYVSLLYFLKKKKKSQLKKWLNLHECSLANKWNAASFLKEKSSQKYVLHFYLLYKQTNVYKRLQIGKIRILKR